MNALRYTVGDATRFGTSARPAVLVHIVNSEARWGAGFVLAVSARWPHVEHDYRRWARGETDDAFVLGAVRHVSVGPRLWVGNMLAQRGLPSRSNPAPLDYPALRRCLDVVAAHAVRHGADVHMPRIGAGLARGRWSSIAPLIEDTLSCNGIDVTVYDLPSSATARR